MRTARSLLVAGQVSLVAATMVGGSVLSDVEDVSLLDGVWLAFSVVSTTGFGAGPVTSSGRIAAMAIFAWAVVSYLLLAVAAMLTTRELGQHRRRQRVIAERDVRRVIEELHPN